MAGRLPLVKEILRLTDEYLRLKKLEAHLERWGEAPPPVIRREKRKQFPDEVPKDPAEILRARNNLRTRISKWRKQQQGLSVTSAKYQELEKTLKAATEYERKLDHALQK